MSEEDAAAGKDKESALLLTKTGVLDSRDLVTPRGPMFSYEERDVPEPGDSAASPGEPVDDDEAAEGDRAPSQCTYDGCAQTSAQAAKQRRPWMCRKHRIKMYKERSGLI